MKQEKRSLKEMGVDDKTKARKVLGNIADHTIPKQAFF